MSGSIQAWLHDDGTIEYQNEIFCKPDAAESEIELDPFNGLPKSMNIYALQGHKVIVPESGFNGGTEWDREYALKHLKLGETYTVKRTEVSGSSTRVYLEGIDASFNSCLFRDVERQSGAKDKEHPDWLYWNR